MQTSFEKITNLSEITSPAPSDEGNRRSEEEEEEADDFTGLDDIVIKIDQMADRRSQFGEVDLAVTREKLEG